MLEEIAAEVSERGGDCRNVDAWSKREWKVTCSRKREHITKIRPRAESSQQARACGNGGGPISDSSSWPDSLYSLLTLGRPDMLMQLVSGCHNL